MEVRAWAKREWSYLQEDFTMRKNTGHVRECHGDLHAGNITLFEGDPCVFDALEFDPRLRWIDVMSEVAFFVMDLQKKGRAHLAWYFLNRYLEVTGDYRGMVVFRFYQVYRALVRAKVAGLGYRRGVQTHTLFLLETSPFFFTISSLALHIRTNPNGTQRL